MSKSRRVLNIGAGKKQIKGAVNIDIISHRGLDKVCDITKGIPYFDYEFNEVVADYVLTQIADRDVFKYVMNEIWRVLKDGGILKLKVPNADFKGTTCQFNDPMDCRYFAKETFDYFDYKHYRYKVFNYGFKPWKILKIEEIGNQANPELKNRLYVEMQKITSE